MTLRYYLTLALPLSVAAVYDDDERLLLGNAALLTPAEFRELVAAHQAELEDVIPERSDPRR